MDELLNEIKETCKKYRFDSLQQLIFSAQRFLKEEKVEISIFGQFKAGKSSFINSLIGKQTLPVGVIPVTSVVTKIVFGKQESVHIFYQNGKTEKIKLGRISDFITETNNPDNSKGVESVIVELPELHEYRGLSFIDTPGIGSVFLKNTLVANDNVASTIIAIVCISAERPLSASDLDLIRKLDVNAYRVICLLTKTDLFRDDQLTEIISFIEKSLQNETGKVIPVYKYSIIENAGYFRKIIQDDILFPYLEKLNDEIDKMYQFKIDNIAKKCVEYLKVAYQASQKTDNERSNLKLKIFDEKTNISFIRHELTTIATESKSRIRELVYTILEPYSEDIYKELKQDLQNCFFSWRGNLYQVTRKFELWLNSSLSEELAKIISEERKEFTAIMSEVSKKFSFYTRNWKERINGKIDKVLGIQLTVQEWEPEFKPISNPDTTVYPAFDTPIDLLWFLFPMFLFRKLFMKYFIHQISAEVDKNIHRTTSLISQKIFREIELYKEQSLDHLFKELNTMERILSVENNGKEELKKHIDSLTQKIKTRI